MAMYHWAMPRRRKRPTRFKYETDHKKCRPCPPGNAANSVKRAAYRLVSGKKPIPKEEFWPPAIQTPDRSFKTKKKMCSGFALSFFETEPQARRHYHRLRNQLKQWKLDHVAETKIEPGDGKVTPTNSKGHFGLHEFKNCDLGTKSTILGKASC